MSNADVILKSFDLVDFRLHKPILATASPFFRDMFSLPQPPDSEVVDGLPVVRVSDDAEILNSLVTFLYPVPSELPDSDDKTLTLLAACQKYDMSTIQSSIRAEVSHRGSLSPTGAECFRLFSIAYSKRLIPETKAVARLTLGYPLTFEYLGEALRSFEGSALSDLAKFHQNRRDDIISCFGAFLNRRIETSKIWVGCPTQKPSPFQPEGKDNIPDWLRKIFTEKINQLRTFTSPLVTPTRIREEYLEALRDHVSKEDCSVCPKTHTLKGKEFCEEIENQLTQAWNTSFSFRTESPDSERASTLVSIPSRLLSLRLVAYSSPSRQIVEWAWYDLCGRRRIV